MPETPIRAQLLADLVEAARAPVAAGPPIAVHAAPGSTVIIYAQPQAAPATAPTSTPTELPA